MAHPSEDSPFSLMGFVNDIHSLNLQCALWGWQPVLGLCCPVEDMSTLEYLDLAQVQSHYPKSSHGYPHYLVHYAWLDIALSNITPAP